MSAERSDEERIERLRAALSTEPGVAVAYLFGSRALGHARADSDWDVAALLDPSLDPWSALALADRLESALGQQVDLVDLRGAPIELAARVLVDGRLLRARSDHERVEYEARTLARAHDMAPLLERIRQEILEERPHERAVERYREASRAAGRLRRPA